VIIRDFRTENMCSCCLVYALYNVTQIYSPNHIIAFSLRTGEPRVLRSVPGRGNRYFSSQQPIQLWASSGRKHKINISVAGVSVEGNVGNTR
jgi:hypothetical protein